MSEIAQNRNYKDSVFVDLHSEDKLLRKQAVIDIYNALHDEKFTINEEIRFLKLKSVFFHKVRNDVSFTVDDKLMVLLEHQSTINPNMPFRCLEYVTYLYASEMMDPEDKFLPTPLSLLAPEFYTLYNGKAPYPARKILPLSSLFRIKPVNPQLELNVTVININHPDNQEFLSSCPILAGYKKLVDKVEQYKNAYGKQGVAMAIEECIKEGIEITNYLKRKTMEVMHMFSLEYNFNAELNAYKIVGRAEGRAEGAHLNAINTAKRLLDMGLSVDDIVKATMLQKEEIKKILQ